MAQSSRFSSCPGTRPGFFRGVCRGFPGLALKASRVKEPHREALDRAVSVYQPEGFSWVLWAHGGEPAIGTPIHSRNWPCILGQYGAEPSLRAAWPDGSCGLIGVSIFSTMSRGNPADAPVSCRDIRYRNRTLTELLSTKPQPLTMFVPTCRQRCSDAASRPTANKQQRERVAGGRELEHASTSRTRPSARSAVVRVRFPPF